MSNQDKIRELIKKREEAKLGGGVKRTDAQHAKGNLIPFGLQIHHYFQSGKVDGVIDRDFSAW